jgi:hypothetical protein
MPQRVRMRRPLDLLPCVAGARGLRAAAPPETKDEMNHGQTRCARDSEGRPVHVSIRGKTPRWLYNTPLPANPGKDVL